MSHHIPFDIQSEIMKSLPVKSIVQFRCVSKQWKSFIDSPKFISNYHINHTNPQHRLLLSYEMDNVHTFTSIIDDNTFPRQKFPLTAPESLSLLRMKLTINSVDGLLCFHGDVDSKTDMAVIWNPTVRKSVAIVIHSPKPGYTIVGFGVCPDTRVPKLVKITEDNDETSRMWVVEVFTLSTRAWKTVYMDVPVISGDLFSCFQVFVDGVIYFLAYEDIYLDDNELVRSNFVISFDLKSEKFGEVCLPERLVHTCYLDVTKVNESLGLLEYYNDDDMPVCGVWMRKDGANESFSKIYTVKVQRNFRRVLGFRNNGEVGMKMYDDEYKYKFEVYEPFSGHVYGVGINGEISTFFMSSYMETLLLLDESDSIIH